jgi:hypothetical protein
MSGSLDVTFKSNGRSANIAEIGNQVMILFTSPPATATGVKVEVHEQPGPGDQVRADRLLATYSGSIANGKFKLDTLGTGDPFASPPANPEIAPIKNNRTVQLDLQFLDDPKSNPLFLPDIEDENGSYEMQFKVSGTIDGKAATVFNSATLTLSLWRDAMIVPDIAAATAAQKKSGDFKIFAANAHFAEQWRKFAGARRSIVKIPIDATLSIFEAKMAEAAATTKNGDIILFVGHGSGGGTSHTEAAFDTTPSSVAGFSNHPNIITETVMTLPDLADPDPNHPGKWIKKPLAGTNQDAVDAVAIKFESLKRVGVVLQNAGVKRLILMTCNVGSAPGFTTNLAKILFVQVLGYSGFAATEQNGAFTQVWITQDHDHPDTDRPPDLPPDGTGFHEVPAHPR